VLHGVVDFNKSCEHFRNRFMPPRGLPVWYHRCTECGFLFTAQFDGWSHDDWKREVYNSEYALVDPDAAQVRPLNNIGLVTDVSRQLGSKRILDYGGGDGTLGINLCERCFDAQWWDVFYDQPRPSGDFDLITCFEVFEHTPTPKETLSDLLSFLRPGGSVLFSTLLLEPQAPHDCSHWYIAPRNGHVSIHSAKSLASLFGEGWTLQTVSEVYHLAQWTGR
jgi:SAM-dependent methyltransferase